MRYAISLFIYICISLSVQGQRAMWWNVENLFDCRDDSLRQDEEFLPEGERRWTPGRYWRKLDNVARTLAAVAEKSGWPVLVGMCEVENDTVLHDLVQRSPLRMAGYRYLHHESADVRGIDVALLYQPLLFRPLSSVSVRVPSVENGFRPTRDILHVRGIWCATDTLDVLLAHLPSRSGASRQSAMHRKLATSTLCAVLDSLQNRKILLMGDFNAEHGDAVLDSLQHRLCSMMPQSRRELRHSPGTYYFRGQWGFLDHIMVSKSLRPMLEKRAEVGRFPFLLDEKGVPLRTYRGPVYMGGYSDHLPIWVDWLSR